MKKQLIIGAIIASTSHTLWADEYHFNNLLIGKNAIGLGGAFTAVANDLSAIHYNPAGLVYVERGNLASINTFAWERTSFENVFGNGDDFNRDAFSVIPGFFGIKYKVQDWHLGAAFIVKDFSQERSNNSATYNLPATAEIPAPQVQTEFATIDIDNSAYQIQLSGGKALNENWSIGLGLGIQLRSFQTDQSSGAINQVFLSEENVISTGFQATARFSDENWMAEPSVSILYRKEGLSLGAKLSKYYVIDRSHEFVTTIAVSGIDPTTPGVRTAIYDIEEACCKQQFPINLTTGFAYDFNRWQLSADVIHYFDVDQKVENLTQFARNITLDFDAITNYAMGISYRFSDYQSIQFGVFTDNANSSIDLTVPFQRLEVIDLVGLSISYDTKISDFPISFGGYAKFGDGLVRISDTRAVDAAVGVPLYPASDNNDISDASKSSYVAFFSIDF